MAPQERSAWIMLLTALVGYGLYVVLLLRRADGSLTDTSYVDLVLWMIGGSIVASMVLHAVARVYVDQPKPDERDREIRIRADAIGQAFLVVGGLTAMVLAMREQPHFWIANALYLGFTLSAILGSIAKIGFYRGGVPGW